MIHLTGAAKTALFLKNLPTNAPLTNMNQEISNILLLLVDISNLCIQRGFNTPHKLA